MQSDMADGLSDEVATSLFAVPGVRVMSRGAVGRYRGMRDIDPQKVGQALGARLLVMGSLRGTGSRFTVNGEPRRRPGRHQSVGCRARTK